jgi:PhnB protein
MPKAKSAAKAKKNSLSRKIVKKKMVKPATAARTKKKKVLAIPKGYNTVTPYLIVENAAKAIEFYRKAFKAKVTAKMDRPDGKIAHSELKIGDSKIMLADECPEFGARSPKAFGGAAITLHLYVKNVDKTIALATAAGAKLLRPVEDMFYGDRCAFLEDQYGHKWHVATHIEDVSTRELKKRAAQVFKKK